MEMWIWRCGDVEMWRFVDKEMWMWKFGVIDAAKLWFWLVEVLRYKTNSQLML